MRQPEETLGAAVRQIELALEQFQYERQRLRPHPEDRLQPEGEAGGMAEQTIRLPGWAVRLSQSTTHPLGHSAFSANPPHLHRI